jgi:hypothetical protein
MSAIKKKWQFRFERRDGDTWVSDPAYTVDLPSKSWVYRAPDGGYFAREYELLPKIRAIIPRGTHITTMPLVVQTHTGELGTVQSSQLFMGDDDFKFRMNKHPNWRCVLERVPV